MKSDCGGLTDDALHRCRAGLATIADAVWLGR